MKTKTIFKALALAMMMPAMMLPTACSNDNDVIVTPENDKEGYALPVTINVTREGDATTRAEYNDGTKTLAFSTGDKLFVTGTDATAGQFAGTLTWVSEGTFTGTIYTQYEYTGTADALLTGAGSRTATLLPDGYDTSYEYLSISNPDSYSATLATDATKAFATTKAAAVEQLSLEQATTYSSGFALAPQNAILNFTVTGLTVGTPSTVTFTAGSTTISGSVTPEEVNYRGTATFAMAVAHSATASSLTLTVDGTAVSLGSHTLTAGKIYSQKLNNINGASPYIQNNEKWIVYGTGEPSGWRLRIAEGATVTLHNVYLNNSAIIAYSGNNTIILADGTTNTIDPGSGVAIDGTMADDKTLTIKGTGTLIATGGYGAPAIGVENPDYPCGAITIESTVHLTATAGEYQSKAITTGSGGGTVTIGGVVYADGADSPFTYPAPSTVTWDNTNVFIYDNRLVNIGNQGLNSGTYEGITVTYDGALCSSQFSFYDSDYGPVIDIYGNKGDSYTFTAPIGKKFTKIEINNNRTYDFTEHGDWTRESNNLVWEGTPSNAVTLGGSGTGETYCFVTSIVFTLQ